MFEPGFNVGDSGGARLRALFESVSLFIRISRRRKTSLDELPNKESLVRHRFPAYPASYLRPSIRKFPIASCMHCIPGAGVFTVGFLNSLGESSHGVVEEH